ncbi:iron reductase [Trametes versicolor FP-101664 SS1]|uniref:iron reductase n=1 Tax=Trametes versicolor (strain FP-101664) TaxID=717944 RepID=UPI0004623BE6|nr:iron reductase [Trametes versicolor FP-101664 SS1]EIW56151.1 iron reductase [Trametes versicolor FP-101664 SS1]
MSVFAAAATNGSTAAPAPVAAGPVVNNTELVFNVDLFLLCAVAIFVLMLLPRAAVRFTHKREWTNGHFLHSVAVTGVSAIMRRPSKRDAVLSPFPAAHFPGLKHPQPEGKQFELEETEQWASTTDASHTYASHADLVRKASTATGRERRRQNVPTHMPGWSTMLPTIAAFLRTTIRPGLTIGKGLVELTYFSVMLYAGLYKSNPFTTPIRAGFVAVSQIPMVVALGTKNNVVGMLIGFGYERLNYLHRFAGRMLVLAANVHAIGYFYSWTAAGNFDKYIKQPDMQCALVALIATDLLLLLSTNMFREKFYNSIFIPSHVISVITFLVAVCYHVPFAVPYVLFAVGFYGLDRLMRLVKSRVATARLRPLPDLGMTRVEIPAINAGWRAGQHVRIRVLSLGMGYRRWAEAHPFTIASVSRSASGEGLVLMVKKAGDWTNKLFDLAQRADYGEANRIGSNVRVIIEGPYGGPGHAIFGSFSGAMFVAGGSGVTFALAAVQDLMKKDLEYKSRVRAMELVWCIQDPAALQPLIPLFSTLIAQAQHSYATLRISVFYTRAPKNPEVVKSYRLPPGLTLSPTRPKLPGILSGVVDRSAALFSGGGKERRRGGSALTGVIVGVCGPASLGDEVRRAVAGFPADRRKAIGGIELHEEAFGW